MAAPASPGGSDTLNFTIKHGKAPAAFGELPRSARVEDLRLQLWALCGVEPEHQTVVAYKGSVQRLLREPTATVWDAGLRDGAVVTLVGTDTRGREKFREDEQRSTRHAEAIAAANLAAASRRPTTGPPVRNVGSMHGFAELRALGTGELPAGALPGPSEAHALLERIASDPGIVAIMELHKWSVGLLSEFKPSFETGVVGVTDGCLLGFNKNMGEEISLRLRTDDFEGFRHYRIIIQTVLHELAHMVHSAHDAKFHALNRQLNKEYIALDWRNSRGHSLGSVCPPCGSPRPEVSSGDDPRQLAAAAAVRRQAAQARAKAEAQVQAQPRDQPDPSSARRERPPDDLDVEMPDVLEPEDAPMEHAENHSRPGRAADATSSTHSGPAAVDSASAGAHSQSDRAEPSDGGAGPAVESLGDAAPVLQSAIGTAAGGCGQESAIADTPGSSSTPAAAPAIKPELHLETEPESEPEPDHRDAMTLKIAEINESINKIATRASGGAGEALACIRMLVKSVTNIMQNPGVDKYKSIKKTNRIFSGHAARFPTVPVFLEQVGFQSAIDDPPRFVYVRNDMGLLWVASDLLRTAEAQCLEQSA